MDTKQTGKLGEDIACDYLRNKGYKILQRNFEIKVSRFLKSEIDIVAKKGNTVHFIEVKTLARPNFAQADFGGPELKVNFAKKRKIIKAAEFWLSKNRIALDVPWQIDIITVELIPNLCEITSHMPCEKLSRKVTHFENI